MNDIYSILLENIECLLRVGVFDHEKLQPQRVLISVECMAAQPSEINADSVVRYDTIYYLVREWEKRPHTELLESVAANLASEIMAHDERIINCTLTISKPEIFHGRALPSIVWRAGNFNF